MRFIVLFLLPVIVMAKSNSTTTKTDCFRDLIVLKNIGTEMTLIYLTAGCNILLLGLNITILYAVLGYMKPIISEIRKQTFIIMDNILVSYIPSNVRKMLSCNPEVKLGGDKQSTGKRSKTSKSKPNSKNSKEKTGSASD